MNTIIEKIRAEIERLKKEHQEPTFRGDEYEEGGVNGYQLALDKVLSKLDTLQEQPVMIQWTGNNLKEVIEFAGKDPRFDEWFKTWDEYESYVHSHGNILKLFNEDGTHLEVPVGAWIVKTPDGRNVPSTFLYQEQPVELEKEIEDKIRNVFFDLNGIAIAGSSTYASVEDMVYIARHFYELGRQNECVKVKAESSIDKFILENCTHCTIEHCPGMRECYTSSNKQLQ